MLKSLTNSFKDFHVKYTLTKELYSDTYEYSIYCTSFENNGNIIDSEAVHGITPSFEQAMAIFNLIFINKVTPCTLNDVIIDLLCK